MKLPTHTGTHVDAPGHIFDHYFDAGFDVDTLDLEVLNGPSFLVDVPRNSNITAEVMKSLHIPKGVRRVLLRTLNTDRKLMWKTEFDTSYVGFMKDGAKWMVEDTDIKLLDVLTFCNPNSNSRKLRKEVIQSQYLHITRGSNEVSAVEGKWHLLASVSVFITLLGVDCMRMKSFAKVEEFAETLVKDNGEEHEEHGTQEEEDVEVDVNYTDGVVLVNSNEDEE
ncbi:hypothetical protein C5167_008900 [Papaver somniferum]|uniref:Cyclase family protein n=1 Tax=Papaver somniferum TaxID=3469 RepID=A0A4Y7JYT9_PAPSO|nr:hypothetical protein C5167_008900 [Papaver somniferum]